MKNLLLTLLLFVSVAAVGQVTVTQAPFEISPGTTNAIEVTLPVSASFMTTITVRMKSTNVGTVELSNTGTATISDSPDYAADRYVFLTIYGNKFWVKCSNNADDIEVSW